MKFIQKSFVGFKYLNIFQMYRGKIKTNLVEVGFKQCIKICHSRYMANFVALLK